VVAKEKVTLNTSAVVREGRPTRDNVAEGGMRELSSLQFIAITENTGAAYRDFVEQKWECSMTLSEPHGSHSKPRGKAGVLFRIRERSLI
jgi:hypothetical protein